MTAVRTLRFPSLCVVALSFGAAHATEATTEDIVKYRQAAMKSQREHLAAVTAIVHGKVPYSAHLSGHASALAAIATHIKELFPAATGSSESNALERVWTDAAEFEARAADNARKAAALAQAVSAKATGDLPVRVRELQESCKSCHKDFRKPIK